GSPAGVRARSFSICRRCRWWSARAPRCTPSSAAVCSGDPMLLDASRSRQRYFPCWRFGRIPWGNYSAFAMTSYFPTPDECGHHTIFPGVQIRTCAGDKLMLSLVDLAPHAVVEEHSHPHEQAGLILEGRAIFFIGSEQKTLQPGDFYRIPGQVRHK